MGTYLSTPVTDKCEESGDSLECRDVPCSWSVVDMQGWRKSMEDAHVAVTDISLPFSTRTTGDDPTIAVSDAKVFGVFDGHGGPEVARFCGLYLVSVLTQQPGWREGDLTEEPADKAKHLDGEAAAESKVGRALRGSFHALDRMIGDPARREEIVSLRNLKPQAGERRDAISIPEPKVVEGEPPVVVKNKPVSSNGSSNEEESYKYDSTVGTSEANEAAAPAESVSESGDNADMEQESVMAMEDARKEVCDEMLDDDSDVAVGKEEAAEHDRFMMEVDDNVTSQEDEVGQVDGAKSAKVTAMFEKILALGSSNGQVILEPENGASEEPTAVPATTPSELSIGPSASRPTIIHNGRMICNLPDHAIHAGATAIVAVITGKILTVANAGDSRAVLCRGGGLVFPLSFDHKPQQEREMTRITNAGGFVNHFGRVNGNLNLSRSLGDLKYKQVPGLDPPAQIISAEPDIMQVILEPDDEFIILGCDGIWDCLTNENAVQYVRSRIDTKLPAEIGVEMLDEIISDDPRVTQGIGGDNMTVMIIDLQPNSRKGQESPEAVSTTDNE